MPDPGLVAIRLDGGAWCLPPGIPSNAGFSGRPRPDDLTRWGEEVD